MRFLLVLEDATAVEFLKTGLKNDGHAVELAAGIGDALTKARRCDADVIAVEVGGSRGQDLQMLRSLRETTARSAIVALVDRGEGAQRNHLLDAGAGACLGKPFSVGELVAQARALLGRDGQPAELRYADLTLDLFSRRATRGAKDIVLTTREYSLLEFLMKHPEQVVARRQITQYAWAWDAHASDTNVVDVYINYLRNKVDLGFPVKLIHTMRGAGYVLKQEPVEPAAPAAPAPTS